MPGAPRQRLRHQNSILNPPSSNHGTTAAIDAECRTAISRIERHTKESCAILLRLLATPGLSRYHTVKMHTVLAGFSTDDNPVETFHARQTIAMYKDMPISGNAAEDEEVRLFMLAAQLCLADLLEVIGKQEEAAAILNQYEPEFDALLEREERAHDLAH